MGFEPTTSCLGSTRDKRREPLAPFLGVEYSLSWHGFQLPKSICVALTYDSTNEIKYAFYPIQLLTSFISKSRPFLGSAWPFTPRKSNLVITLPGFLFGQLHCETKGAFVISEEAIASSSPRGRGKSKSIHEKPDVKVLLSLQLHCVTKSQKVKF